MGAGRKRTPKDKELKSAPPFPMHSCTCNRGVLKPRQRLGFPAIRAVPVSGSYPAELMRARDYKDLKAGYEEKGFRS